MKIEVTVKQFPESVADGTLSAWHAKPGQRVERDARIAEIETDKIVLDVNAPEAGVLAEVRAEAGATVKPGDVLAVIDTEAEPAAEAGDKDAGRTEPEADDRKKEPEEEKPDEKQDKEPQSRKGKDPESEPAPEAPARVESRKAGDGDTSNRAEGDGAVLSPAARKLAKEKGVDPADLQGTGRGGRITKADVLKAGELPDTDAGTSAPARSDAAAPAVAPKPRPRPGGAPGRSEERVPMTRIRARIAERLLAAKQQTAMLTTFNEVNLRRVMDLRSRHKEAFEKEHGVKLGFMSFFVKASVEALKKFPAVNAYLDGTDIVYHGYFDVGIAVSSPRGLVVPVLRDAGRLTFAEIEKQIGDFAHRARAATLSLDDLQGGTFTITNGGVFGSMLSTPILNPPQSAILGMHSITERPVAENGEVVIRPMMYLALSYDHRIVDGRDAVQFLVAVRDLLEDPARLLLHL